MLWRRTSDPLAPGSAGLAAAALLAAALLALAAGILLRDQAQQAARPEPGALESIARQTSASATEAKVLLDSLETAQGAAADAYERTLMATLDRLGREAGQLGSRALAGEIRNVIGAVKSGKAGSGRQQAADGLEHVAAAAGAFAEARSLEAHRDALAASRGFARSADWASLAAAVLLGLGILAHLGAAKYDARLRRRVEEVLPPAQEGEDLAARVARLRGRERLALERRDRELLSKLTLVEAYDQLERAQADLYALLSERESQMEQLRVASLRDELTGAFKYLYMVHRIREMFKDLLERGQPFCILSLDLDNFKDVNDQFGHAAGDDALRAFASLLAASCRETDVVIRKSGDEFFILMPGAPFANAMALGERLVDTLKSYEVVSENAFGETHRFRLAASIGALDVSQIDVAALRGVADPDMAVREVLSYVDAALNRAKYTGKGCVRAYEAGLRIEQVGFEESSPDIERLYRYRNLYPGLPPEQKRQFDAVAGELSEMLFPRPRSAGSGEVSDVPYPTAERRNDAPASARGDARGD